MNTKTKNWIRAVVVVGVIGWPGVETYRLCVTTQKMEVAQALERTVKAKLDASRTKHVQMATIGQDSANSAPDAKH